VTPPLRQHWPGCVVEEDPECPNSRPETSRLGIFSFTMCDTAKVPRRSPGHLKNQCPKNRKPPSPAHTFMSGTPTDLLGKAGVKSDRSDWLDPYEAKAGRGRQAQAGGNERETAAITRYQDRILPNHIRNPNNTCCSGKLRQRRNIE
jgi:hypothetical protein